MLKSRALGLRLIGSINRTTGTRALSDGSQGNFSAEDWHSVVCSNGTVACWHPQKRFPYEHSRPIDKAEVERDRKLLAEARRNAEKLRNSTKPFGSEGPDRVSLREIFYTDKQEWYPRPRETRLYRTAAPLGRPRRSTRSTPEQ